MNAKIKNAKYNVLVIGQYIAGVQNIFVFRMEYLALNQPWYSNVHTMLSVIDLK